jgi:hypothetical protein
VLKVLRIKRSASLRGGDQAHAFIRQLELVLERESNKRLATIAATVAALSDDWQTSIEQDIAFVSCLTTVREDMRRRRLVATPRHAEERLRFMVSSRFLGDSHRYLTGDPQQRERMHVVSGVVAPDGTRILSYMEKLTFDEQTAAYVKAAAAQTHKQLVELDRDGHALLAVWHSHIMHGADSTRPSPTDLANQERFVRIGWDALGGIFSLDGYIRLYHTAKDFELATYGNGVERICDEPRAKVLKLTGVSP